MLLSNASTPTIVFVAGEKGGVGKGLMGAIIADRIGPVSHVESDRPNSAQSTTSPFRHEHRKRRPA